MKFAHANLASHKCYITDRAINTIWLRSGSVYYVPVPAFFGRMNKKYLQRKLVGFIYFKYEVCWSNMFGGFNA